MSVTFTQRPFQMEHPYRRSRTERTGAVGVYYRINDIVKYGNVVYRATATHEGTFIDENESYEYVRI